MTQAAIPGQSFYFGDLLQARSAESGLSKGERTRLSLEIATCACLQDISLDQLRVAEICERAGVAYGLFYHYFSDKYEVTVALVRAFIDDIFARYLELHQTGDRYYDIFVANYFYIDTYRQNRGLMRIILSDAEQLSEISVYHAEILSKWHLRLAKSIEGSFGGAPLNERKRLLVAFSIGGMMDEILRQAFVVENKFVAKSFASTFELTETISVLWHRAVYGRDPEAASVRKVVSQFEKKKPAKKK
jgi:AcrR family transcriptional regulator